MQELHFEKGKLRSMMKERLRGMDDVYFQEYSKLACKFAQQHRAFMQAQVIMAYMAMPHEADPAELVQAAYRAGKRMAFPYCAPSHTLLALEPENPEDPACYSRDSYGILTPLRERSRELAPEELDLVLVPGLAFDGQGGRMGRGAGYYDRFLRNISAFRLGFCLSMQLVGYVPMDRFDCYMHGLATNSRYYAQF